MDNLAQPRFIPSDNLMPLGRILPKWVPQIAKVYLAHTEAGIPMRELARAMGQHPSTICRQVQRIEHRRDDPLVDGALRALGVKIPDKEHLMSYLAPVDDISISTETALILNHLKIAGTVLALAQDLDKAVVVRDGPEGSTDRIMIVDREIAMTLALRDWIEPDDPNNRIVRYRITPAGRVAVRDYAHEGQIGPADNLDEPPKGRRARYGAPETPLMHLARRKDADGEPFLQDIHVKAGNRLREDYELARLDDAAPDDWLCYTAGQDCPTGSSPAQKAHMRMAAALQALGPGLGDVVICCCCDLEGLEKAEKNLGWSARSGKVVLRIALTHLARHYDAYAQNQMIG
ncbi:MAG: DUF6456 domain-containing protein [Planktomarina sp.]